MGLLDHVKIENLDEDQRKMVELVGLDGFKSLVRAFGGTTIYIPKAESLERAARDQKIREEFDGGNYREFTVASCALESSARIAAALSFSSFCSAS